MDEIQAAPRNHTPLILVTIFALLACIVAAGGGFAIGKSKERQAMRDQLAHTESQLVDAIEQIKTQKKKIEEINKDRDRVSSLLEFKTHRVDDLLRKLKESQGTAIVKVDPAPGPKGPLSLTPDKPDPLKPKPKPDSRSAVFGDALLEIKSVDVRPIMIDTLLTGRTRSPEVYLVVSVRVTNQSDKKKIDYYPLMPAAANPLGVQVAVQQASATDEHDNLYSLVSFGVGTKVVGPTAPRAIYPGKSINDMMIFERPIDGAKKITFDIPGTSFGTGGSETITISLEE